MGALQCNCVIWGDPVTKQAVIVDPGGEADRILERVAELGLTVAAIVHSHCHIDHVGATAEVRAATGAPTGIHTGDQFLLDTLDQQAGWLGMPPPAVPEVDRALEEGDFVDYGAHRLEVLHTPGHTPGSLTFVGDDGQGPLICAGDTLFLQSIGRTDLPGGDPALIERSIQSKLYTLPPETRVIPGHGPATSIGHERVNNMFVRA